MAFVVTCLLYWFYFHMGNGINIFLMVVIFATSGSRKHLHHTLLNDTHNFEIILTRDISLHRLDHTHLFTLKVC